MNDSDNPRHPGKVSPSAIQDAKAELFFGEKPAPGGRFKPGQSGNPSGRPKRAPEASISLQDNAVHLATLRESRRLVTVKTNGTSTEVSMLDAVVQSQITNAVKGNPLAQRDALLRIERAYQQEAREIAASHEFWSRYRAEQWAEIERAKRNRTPLPNPLPHPDDIVLEPGRPVRINGPLDEAEAAQCEEHRRFRDTLLLQDALDEKLEAGEPTAGYRPGGAMLFAMMFNGILPRRLQLSESHMTWQSMQNDGISKRVLLKTLHQAWRALRLPVPRGMRFPSLDMVTARLNLHCDLLAAMRAGEIDTAAIARGEYSEVAQEIVERHGFKVA